jgi:hypothetical protein
VIHRALALAAALFAAGSSLTACTNASCEPYAGNPGACNNFAGYTWNGSRCVIQNGCDCAIVACPGVYSSLMSCQNDHQMCVMDSASDAPAAE